MIHSTHTKKDLIEIIEVFEFDIEDYQDYSKSELSKTLWEYIENINSIQPDCSYFYIENVEQLKDFLTSPNQSRISIKEKNAMIDKAKDILFYCKNGYLLSYSVFVSVDELREEADKLSFYGNIPTINRALTLLNKDKKINPKIDIIQSGKVKIKLRKKKEERLKKMGQLKITKGKHIVRFD